MKLSFTPTLEPSEKYSLESFLTSTLAHERFEGWWPFASYRLSINIDGKAHLISSGEWCRSNGAGALSLARAQDVDTFPLSQRLSVLLTLAQLCEASPALDAAAQGAIGRVLLGQRNEFNGNLVVGASESRGIAFSSDNRIASLIGDEWMLPSGEVVDVSGEGWNVCVAVIPEAITTLAPTHLFAIGDRIRYSRIPHITEESGEGVVESRVREGQDPEGMRMDISVVGGREDGNRFFVLVNDCTLITEDADIDF